MTAQTVHVAGKFWVSLRSFYLYSLISLTLSGFVSTPVFSESCGTDYVIKEGETLAQIAQRVYGNGAQWSFIFYANQDRLGTNATLLVPGQAIKIPCVTAAVQPQQQPTQPTPSKADRAAQPGQPAGFELSSMVKRVEFLTAEGYAPYTDRAASNGGLILDLLTASMNLIKEQAQGNFDYQVSWVNDWSAHLNPLLITRAFDAGIPWTKPDCSNMAILDKNSQYRCQKFFFSEPFYEDVTALFVKTESPIKFDADDEILGKTLCRTRGGSTYDLNKGGRNWVRDNKIVLMQPASAEECFRLLEKGTVDAVVISDLTGRTIAAEMGMLERVRAISRPVNIETMHVIVAKTHPNARTILYYVNSSLAKLRETGAYDKIVAKHLEQFWSSLDEKKAPEPAKPSPKATSATKAAKQ